MSLFREMGDNYIDGNLLATPSPVAIGVRQGSDNGPMYSSEELVMLLKGAGTTDQADSVLWAIRQCINPATGLLQRFPVRHGTGWQVGPDDYYGVLNGFKQAKSTQEARGFLRAAIRYRGALNNVNPGVWTSESFLVRQLQMLAAMVATAYPSPWRPDHWLVRLLAFPLFLYTALVLLTSCTYRVKEVNGRFAGFERVPTGATDERRLAWHLGETVKCSSLLCWLAYKLWTRRLYRDYPPSLGNGVGVQGGMRSVAAIYYHGLPDGTSHPFARYWPL